MNMSEGFDIPGPAVDFNPLSLDHDVAAAFHWLLSQIVRTFYLTCVLFFWLMEIEKSTLPHPSSLSRCVCSLPLPKRQQPAGSVFVLIPFLYFEFGISFPSRTSCIYLGFRWNAEGDGKLAATWSLWLMVGHFHFPSDWLNPGVFRAPPGKQYMMSLELHAEWIPLHA